MALHPDVSYWPELLLLVTINAGRESYGVLCEYASQLEIMEWITVNICTCPAGLTATCLTEDTFDMLVDTYKANMRYIEGG